MSDNAKLVLTLARYSLAHWAHSNGRFVGTNGGAAHAYEHSARLAARTLFGRELRLPGDFNR